MKKTPMHKPLTQDEILKQNIFFKILKGKHMHYRKYPDGSSHLLDGETDTGIAVKRSHEGYNHFACWYVTDCGKIKRKYPIKEKSEALIGGKLLYLDKLTNEVLKKGRGK